MADPYSDLAHQDAALQTRIADAMEARCREDAQIELRRNYLSGLDLPADAFAVELGSGTGHVTHDLLTLAGAHSALGIEPSPVMVERAQTAFEHTEGLSFRMGDAKTTGLGDASVDLVLMHTLLCHVPGPEDVVREAHRILKPGGLLAICDGDYDTATAQIAEFDPLDQLVRFMINQNVTNLWIMRQISEILATNGFELGRRRGHGYIAEGDASYFLTVIDRGADRMTETGLLQPDTASALKQEARARVANDSFFGFMSYVSQIARKPVQG
ncbi:MAG: methyltransferase domain-containing protein [Pseudomonadota bacterium]